MNRYSADPSRLLFDANGARELDRLAIEEEGIAGILLMKRAGKAVFSAIRETWPSTKNLVIFFGDGYITAGFAIQSGMQVQLFETAKPGSIIVDAPLGTGFCGEPRDVIPIGRELLNGG